MLASLAVIILYDKLIFEGIQIVLANLGKDAIFLAIIDDSEKNNIKNRLHKVRFF